MDDRPALSGAEFAAIERLVLPGGTRLALPRRDFGKVGLAGVFVTLFGLAFAGAAAFQIVRTVAGMVAGSSGGSLAFDLVFALPFLAVGIVALNIALCLLSPPRAEVDLLGDTIVTRDRIGPFRVTRQRRGTVTMLDVTVMETTSNGKRVSTGAWADMAMLRAEFEDAEPLLIAPFYPRPVLRALADALAGELGAVTGAGDAPAIEVTESRTDDERNPADTPERPTGSTITIEPTPDGLTIVAPPVGIWKGSKGLLFFALLWCAILSVITGGIVVSVFSSSMGTPGILAGGAFLLLFWGVGAALVGYTVHAGRRSTVLDVVGDSLLVTRKSVFGGWVAALDHAQIESIGVQESGMEVNDRPVFELRIHLTEKVQVGKKRRDSIRLFSERDDAELIWLGATLRNALGVSAHAPARDADGRAV